MLPMLIEETRAVAMTLSCRTDDAHGRPIHDRHRQSARAYAPLFQGGYALAPRTITKRSGAPPLSGSVFDVGSPVPQIKRLEIDIEKRRLGSLPYRHFHGVV